MNPPGNNNTAAVSGIPGANAGVRDVLSQAVISTVAYNDVFGYPPDLQEIHRYLHDVAATLADVTEAADKLVSGKTLLSNGAWFALPGRDNYFDQRSARQRVADSLWPSAKTLARMLASIPTVQMVGITGSLAVNNTRFGADIDFMLVVDEGTVWRTRALSKALQVLSHRLGAKLCVNYLLSSRALRLPSRSLYIAHELAQMVPVYGESMYEQLRQANTWSSDYLPNAGGRPQAGTAIAPIPAIRSIARPMLGSALASRVEHWECRRKLHRYNDTGFLPGEYSLFTPEATGHRIHVRKEIEEQHRFRLNHHESARPLRALFGQSYHLYFDPKLWREHKPYPPLGSLYGAAVARRAGYDVRFFDSMLCTDRSEWPARLDRERPDVVVLYEDNFNYLTKMCLLRMREAALEMIAAARRVNATIIVCSSDAVDHAGLYLTAGAEVVIRGEGEQVLLEVLNRIGKAGKAAPADIPGAIFRNPRGDIVENPRMPVIRKLDELPNPAWDLVDLKRYRDIWRRRHGRFSVNMVTTRGCPYHCNWCAKPIWGQRYNSRSPQNVVAELSELVNSAKPDHVWFMDDIFGLKPGWVRKFADCLRDAGIKIRFKCLTRPDLLRRPGEVEALAQAGCDIVWIGAESGSQNVLDAMEKGTDVSDIVDMSAKLRAHGIRVGHFIQFGYPGESWNDIKKTLHMVREVLPDELGVSVSYPLPGTTFYERVQAELGPKRNWRDSEDLAMLYRGPYGTRFYRVLHRHVHRFLAWHRTISEVSSGSFFKRPLIRQIRRLAYFSLLSVSLPPSALRLRYTATRHPKPVSALPTSLDRQAAAMPSEQNPE